jgi:hypothetical protein
VSALERTVELSEVFLEGPDTTDGILFLLVNQQMKHEFGAICHMSDLASKCFL